MRFKSLSVSNLKAVRQFQVTDLSDFVMIAGPNGCGKSCVFDAIRLLKSLYGGHSTDEHMQWFAEFAINPQDKRALTRIFRDPEEPVHVSGVIEFAESERTYMRENARDLVLPIAWQAVTGQRMDHWSFNRVAIATQMAQQGPDFEKAIADIAGALVAELDQEEHELSATLRPDAALDIQPSTAARVSFQAFKPGDLGIIEFHSASRTYVRQAVGGINLDSQEFENQRRQHMLYNWQNKYQNVKSELAAGYLRSLIAEKMDAPAEGEQLDETLKELFRTFFPDKTYRGVQPAAGGGLEFPVELPGGETHDIDELSSGEKEILYGYLRLRNSTPKRSVILLDEPELHLNPSLLQGFADFYYRHLGVAQENQLWLVTHSDTLLRQAVGNSHYRIFHMLSASNSQGNQASEVLLDNDIENVVIEIVGDLAAYRPHAKVVILEGAEVDGFDERFVRTLFPDFAKRVNLVSAGPKRRVKDLYEVLKLATDQVGIENRFFAIVDRDSDEFDAEVDSPTEFVWGVYHVENFLLDAECLRLASESITGNPVFSSDEAVDEALREAAEQIADRLALTRIKSDLNRQLVSSIDISASPDTNDIAADLMPSVIASLHRVSDLGDGISEESVNARVDEVKAELAKQLDTGEWRATFPGRDILKRFAANHLGGAGYEVLRNVTLERMVLLGVKPGGMSKVFDEILKVD